MKFKARIKSLEIEYEQIFIRKVVFEPLDRTMVCGEPHYFAINSGQVVELPMSACSLKIDNDLFDFLSQHSKEEFVIEIDNQNNDTSDNNNNKTIDNQNNVTVDNKYSVVNIKLIYG